MKLKDHRYQQLDDLFGYCLQGRQPEAVFHAEVVPQPPAWAILTAAVVGVIPPFLFLTIFLCALGMVVVPCWLVWHLARLAMEEPTRGLGDFIIVSDGEFTIVRRVQQVTESGEFRAHSTVTWPTAAIQHFGDRLTAAVIHHDAEKLPIQTKFWLYFVSPKGVPPLKGLTSRLFDRLEPLDDLVPALKGSRAVRRLDG